MENKNVGYLILGISVLIVAIIFLFNSAMTEIATSSCTMEKSICPMYKTINQQTYLSFGIVGLLIIVGLILIFSKQTERIIIKKVEGKIKKKILDTSGLKSEEKKILRLVEENKTIFQADLIEKTGFGKAKISRILDRLEGKGFIERKRRGMTNVVVLKE